MPAAKLFVKKRKGMGRMRATSVCRLAIKTGLLLAALAGCAVLAGAQRPPGARGDEETFRFRFVGPRAGTGWLRSRVFPATRAPITPERRPVVFGKPRTAGIAGNPFSTRSR